MGGDGSRQIIDKLRGYWEFECVKKLPISLTVITLNEEKNIERCLKSVPWAAEIVVLDSGSQDLTCEIAQNLGARVFREEFRGYRAQKERATELATEEWVLSLDADEALSENLSNEICSRFEEDLSQVDGFQVRRANFHLGRWISHGGWYPDRWIRLFRKEKAIWKGGNVHEKVEVESFEDLTGHILHRVFEDLSDQVETNNRYSGLGAKDLFEKKKDFSLFKLLTKPISKFVETYFFKRGFLDGLPGFIISVGAAYSVFLKFSKLWEIQYLNGKTDELYNVFEKRVK